MNGVFLIALCVSIFLEAIQRFVEPQVISKPLLIVGVGSAGLVSNILGLFLFHEHGHSHGTEDSKSDSDNGDDLERMLPSSQVRAATASHAGHDHSHNNKKTRRHSHSMSSDDIYVHPAQNRAAIQDLAGGHRVAGASETSPLLGSADHSQHNHAKPRDASAGGSHGHDHSNMNMRAVFLHVLGDALGNIGVIATGLFVYFTTFSWRFYSDPVISLVITMIILTSAIPLCKSASLILLQVAPPGILVDEIKEDIKSLDNVHSVHELHVWQLSDTKLVASVHVRIENDQGKYMQIATDIKKCLHAFGIHSCTIQPEFIKGLDTLPEAVDECLLDCDVECAPAAKAHDHDHDHTGHSH